MRAIDIDFDVFKEITLRRSTEDVTPNDVLRELLGLTPSQKDQISKATSEKQWVVKGVVFPPGTQFRAKYKGQIYYAKVVDGALAFNGEKFSSPSSAAISITGNSVNGWIFWECKLPGSDLWHQMRKHREKSLNAIDDDSNL